MADEVRVTWEGKRSARIEFDPMPTLRCVEEIGAPDPDRPNRLIQGDNLAAMAALQGEMEGKIDLLYLDPPFFTGREWRTREANREDASAFTDSWQTLGDYLQWLFDRLTMARTLLSPTGSLYLHLSWHSVHYAKLLLDEIFGVERFQNEIIWCYREAINSKKRWNRKHDTLLFYTNSDTFTFHPERVLRPYSETNVRKYRHRDEKGAYRIMGRGLTNSPLRSKRDLSPETEANFPELTFRHYLGEGTLPLDYWNIDIENQASARRTGYPTQKPEALLERILLASSNPGDLVADFCCGSGTTLAVAQRLDRRWIGCDFGDAAIQTTRTRLQSLFTGFRFETLT